MKKKKNKRTEDLYPPDNNTSNEGHKIIKNNLIN